MKIVIPMAGKGSRFLEAVSQNPEYATPKPIINVLGKPMVQWAIESLPFVNLPSRPARISLQVQPKDLVFICRQDHQDDFQIGDKLKKVFTQDIRLVFLDQITRGATETVLKSKAYIDNEEDLIVSDSDHHFQGDALYAAIANKASDVAGIIPVFTPPDSDVKWSYTLFDKDHLALAVGEKDPELAAQGASANIGAYYFSSGKNFVNEAELMIREGDMYGAEGKKEFYLAPIYNRLIKKGQKIKVALIPKVWGLGTPKDLEFFLKDYTN